ncbi:MAG TPA: class I SAM-dependent methyltransferase [Bacteroidales bacterium]|nr:class I SAM-dependent methyltransferase [Bacteroidales bacterium]
MKNKKIVNRYIEVHNKMLQENGFTSEALWGSKDSQYVRFAKISEIFKSKTGFSVLDLGCGLCDFYDYLNENNYSKISYTGLEINQTFYEHVCKEKPKCNIILGNIDKLPAEFQWDYVIASGIYNLGTSSKENLKIFIQQFKDLYERINVGFAVNFLSVFSDNPKSDSIYFNPAEVLNLCIKEFSKYVRIDQTYLPHDFTVFIYKNKQEIR